ncbi:MAG: hypothetical protein J0H50_12285 [Xanthomonadales bacterium]|nr:hypothetical protein [Xanthomonadales bacterium]
MSTSRLLGLTIAGFVAAVTTLVAPPSVARAQAATTAQTGQSTQYYAGMHWRTIGPTRGGRARALDGVPSQPNVFYAGFDNGGVWRSTDYGSNWVPLFDDQPTGSIGAIAVAPSDPNVIYVGTGAGIIRPDLAVGDGMYKSTDAGKTWTHLGLRDTQMIAHIAVDPHDPNRLFVAALGHPYGPNEERGIFRSTDGGKTFQKVLYKNEYVSGNDVRIDPSNPSIVYAGLWQQQQSYIEGKEFGGTTGGIFKSTDGGSTWKELTNGLPAGVIEANLSIAPSNPNIVYAMVAGTAGKVPTAKEGTTGTVQFYKSSDGGEHWNLAARDPANPGSSPDAVLDPRPATRIGGGDLPTLAVDGKDPNVVYAASTVFWRTEDGGVTWSAVRGGPNGDDYQKPWVNPNNSDIVFVVVDQGATVSANRGKSWSTWYNQLTGAMYHVTPDDAFPYRVCSGQQDSGSACVDSRSMDGRITFHDWHSVSIQEYGIAAPDPKNPDLVFGSGRNNVTLYDRRTGQTTMVGPSREQRGKDYDRNVRTMPILWSPKDPTLLFYASNVVWKSSDQAHSWTRISPDLARSTWKTPVSVGKYAKQVKPAPEGSITALSASPLDVDVLWAGTDDGNIQVTMDGGKHWSNVTPPAIKPWTRIYNIEAGHFDKLTAYAAANTMRIDDMNPHLWRTRDGGKTWTEINNGIDPGVLTNTIREDPRKPGLLYAGTDTQVWVSFDDGDHWESLRLDMPAISVRDLAIKDDEKCGCSDLLAGTHGRGFYILDDVTPLRQIAEARQADPAYLFKPQVATRVRLVTYDSMPFPPEVPSGENPPNGAVIDYYLASDVAGPVTIDILDGAGQVVRTYSSTIKSNDPDPALDPDAYNKLCQAKPHAPNCSIPLYWPAPLMSLSTKAGMHRISWSMRYQPLAQERSEIRRPIVIPHRSSVVPSSPWAPPGEYTVRLTAAGKTYTQPLTVRLDPRVTTPAAGIAQISQLSVEMYELARTTLLAYSQAHGLSEAVAKLEGTDPAAKSFKASLDAIAESAGARRFGLPWPTPATLKDVSNAALAASLGLDSADSTPTAAQVDACTQAREIAKTVLAKWDALKGDGLAALNAKLAGKGQPALALPEAKLPQALPADVNGNLMRMMQLR